MITCGNCGQENPAGARFCFSCGKPFDDAPVREERKVVTVLFADLVGFTSRAEQMDPEDVRALLAPYWQHLRDELERYGGTVEKFIGDAVMALFGAPVAHEDDPERAIFAALDMLDATAEFASQLKSTHGIDFRIRAGINSGPVMVGITSVPSGPSASRSAPIKPKGPPSTGRTARNEVWTSSTPPARTPRSRS